MTRRGYTPGMRPTLAAILIALVIPSAIAEEFQARVVGVSDGDTLTVLRDGRTQVKARLHAIDAPESVQDFVTRAKHAASELALGKTVTVEERHVDRYGRIVAVAILPDGWSLNEEQVRQGTAWHYVRYAPDDRALA